MKTNISEKQLYYFQVPQKGKRWDECKPISMEFNTREDGVNAAYLLSKIFKTTIRFTDNEFYMGNSGTYIQSKEI